MHGYTPSGSVSVTTNPSFSGTNGTVSVSGANHTHSVNDPGHGHSVQGSQQTVSNRNTYPLLSDSPIKDVSIVNSSTTGISLNKSGNLSMSGNFTPSGSISGGSYTFTGTNGNTSYDGGNEARPDNYTIRVWKRIA